MAAQGPQQIPIEEKLAAFDSVPLFMKSLPEEATDDAAISALQSLAYEGTPDEVAQNFKEQGNDYFKGKRYREARDFYTQGIDAKPEDKSILEALLCNRAACNLELRRSRRASRDRSTAYLVIFPENYGSVLRDCSKAIGVNPKSSKAYYRSALALIALERYDEALDCCDRCLQFDKDNKAERNIVVVPVPDTVAQNPYEPEFEPEDLTNNTLIFPVLFLYPQYATSDLISHFQEDTPFSAHISAMFPPNAPRPDWDKKGEYVDGNLVVYGFTRRQRLLKIGKKMTLRDVCKAAKAKDGEPRDGLELKDGTLTFVVLPKGEQEQKWVEDFKKNRASQSS
ncbi:hypothetical protein BN946_scf184652.g59 [Trametes cinnabarina]|uniref:Cns1/TTC4 wheel domain-containing protein n=1 Tax=Pycnoporus cinnabarinus TaxID=5643 RepID=A0A060S2W9_PYCCI|nr:hypothetical protein BN946_scf184652.g59 [Trametes cinnabarina]